MDRELHELDSTQHLSNLYRLSLENRKKERPSPLQIDIIDLEGNHWAVDAIKGGNSTKAILLDKDKLIDFVTTASASFGVFRVVVNGSSRYYFMYISERVLGQKG